MDDLIIGKPDNKQKGSPSVGPALPDLGAPLIILQVLELLSN